MKQLVCVTSKHIRKGKQGEPSCCPIALALAEQVGSNPYVCSDAAINVAGKRLRAKLPTRAHRFISKFDNNKKSVKPFKFWFKGQAEVQPISWY